MQHGYNVLREEDRQAMLSKAGASSMDDLLSFIPKSIQLDRELTLPPAMNEWQLNQHLTELANRNETAETHACLLGGGVYDHYVPEVVNMVAERGEFITAYTPYQPEISQGLLRALSDFQLTVGHLFDMPFVNCSVYDGATALAESAWMAISYKDNKRILVSEAIWPQYREVLELYMANRGVSIEYIPYDAKSGTMNLNALKALLKAPAAAVVTQYTNHFGTIEPLAAITKLAHTGNALSIAGCYPIALGVLKAPGACGADIVYAEGQSLGLNLAAGGPYVGMIGTREELVDYLPGRLVGETQDIKGEPALALIKQEREQHVRRHEATSHICSNQALMAIRVLVYLSLMGETGLRRIATLNAQKADYLCDKLTSIAGVERVFDGAYFNEFMVKVPVDAVALLENLRKVGYHGGIASEVAGEQHLLIAVTETKSRDTLDAFAAAVANAITQLS